VLDGVLDQLTAATVTATAAAGSGLPPEQLAEIAQASLTSGPPLEVTEGQAADEQLGPAAGLVAGQTGLFLLFTVGFGVLGLVTEREQGTLARLHAMPMRPGLIIAAKGLVSFVLGVVATSVLLTVGGLLFGVSFGSPVAVAVLVVCVVAAATSLMFIIARVARTAEQAGIAQSIVALVLGIAGGAFFPITGTGALAQVLDLNPIAAFTRGLGITAGGGGVADLGVPVAIMLGFGVVMVLVSRLVPDRGAAL
jgi:ABC-2 type transport system permease protein